MTQEGRGYPSIDSLKEVSNYFSISLDELLSGDKILSIAEKENKANLQSMCDLLWGFLDVSSFLLIVLPLYPNMENGFVNSVNLFAYTQTTELNRFLYWIIYILLVAVGIVKLVLTKLKMERCNKRITEVSMITGILTVLLLAMTKEVYPLIVIFLLLVMKVVIYLKCASK